jgi:hypothetical protein
MKKLIPVALAVAVVFALGAGLAIAGNDNGQGVPSAKCTATTWAFDYVAADDGWHELGNLSTQIKTSEKADLIIEFSAETLLVTDVRVKSLGGGGIDESYSHVQIIVRPEVKVDGVWVPAEPGDVTLNERLVKMAARLWAPSDLPEQDPALLDQFIELYMMTKSANSFNWVLKNVGSGVHDVRVMAKIWTSEDIDADRIYGHVEGVIGKRSLVVESVRMVND